MNCVLTPQDCTSRFNYSPTLYEVVNTFHFTDIWRHFHPHVQDYTFYYSTGASRLDHIYIPKTLIPQCISASIHKLAISDHSLVLMKGNFLAEKHLRPTYHWKLNESLLHNEHYIMVMQQTIQDITQHNRYGTQPPLLRWIAIKRKLIHITQLYSRDIARLKREQFHYNHSLLNHLASRLPSAPHLLPEVKRMQANLKKTVLTKITRFNYP